MTNGAHSLFMCLLAYELTFVLFAIYIFALKCNYFNNMFMHGFESHSVGITE